MNDDSTTLSVIHEYSDKSDGQHVCVSKESDLVRAPIQPGNANPAPGHYITRPPSSPKYANRRRRPAGCVAIAATLTAAHLASHCQGAPGGPGER